MIAGEDWSDFLQCEWSSCCRLFNSGFYSDKPWRIGMVRDNFGKRLGQFKNPNIESIMTSLQVYMKTFAPGKGLGPQMKFSPSDPVLAWCSYLYLCATAPGQCEELRRERASKKLNFWTKILKPPPRAQKITISNKTTAHTAITPGTHSKLPTTTPTTDQDVGKTTTPQLRPTRPQPDF